MVAHRLADDGTLVDANAPASVYMHKHHPAEAGRIYIDRGLAAFGLTTANDAVLMDNSIAGGLWEFIITGQCRSEADLSLILHTGHMDLVPADSPLQTIDSKSAFGPWHVKAAGTWMIKVTGDVSGWDFWQVEFTGQNVVGKRIFDRQVAINNRSQWDLPVVGVNASTGNIYCHAWSRVTKEP